MKVTLLILPIFLFAACLSSCNSTRPTTNETGSSTNENQESENESNEDENEMKLKMKPEVQQTKIRKARMNQMRMKTK